MSDTERHLLLQLSLASDPFQPAFVTCEECPACLALGIRDSIKPAQSLNSSPLCWTSGPTPTPTPTPTARWQGLPQKTRKELIQTFSCCRSTGDLGETLKMRDGWCHVIVTVGVNKQAQQPIFSAGSITHLARRRLRLSAELATIRQTPVVILQHTWTGQDLQGDVGSGWSALPTNAPQVKSHSLEACG